MINRHSLVSRHHVQNTSFAPLSPLTVGNGEFAFTADITGLQTFSESYTKIPLCTQSQWGWHSYPFPVGMDLESFKYTTYQQGEKTHGYMSGSAGQQELYMYLRENPHRLHLGRLGLKMIKKNGEVADITDICSIEQTLILWEGTISSCFQLEGTPVKVTTCCHPHSDTLTVSIKSPMLKENRLSVFIHFPYGSHEMSGANWESVDKHQTTIENQSEREFRFERHLDNACYYTELHFDKEVTLTSPAQHRFLFAASETENLSFCCHFSADQEPGEQEFENVLEASKQHWKNFWEKGAAVELAFSKDKRALELERRIVLSQYLLAVQCAGSLPPQETGLTCNSWYGKFHHEMHWWHAASFPLWNRTELLEKSIDWYFQIADYTRSQTERQGYKGIRWPKMTGNNGKESPSPVGVYLIWQQPHFIYFAQELYRYYNDKARLDKYYPLVMLTAEFMADFVQYDQENDRYILPAPLIPAQENYDATEVLNPTLELEYWHWGLKTAQSWREASGRQREPLWDDIIQKLSALPMDPQAPVYASHEKCMDTYTKRNIDHPSMLYALGILPGEKADSNIMLQTLRKVQKEWNWPSAWGWDFPVAAMTAVRLHQPAMALDLLLMDAQKNTYLKNGHNYQFDALPLYLPGNGGLLTAIAMMCAGWEGYEGEPSPGFPKDGSWTVEWEGLQKIL